MFENVRQNTKPPNTKDTTAKCYPVGSDSKLWSCLVSMCFFPVTAIHDSVRRRAVRAAFIL